MAVILAGSIGFLYPLLTLFPFQSHDLHEYVDRGPIHITAQIAAAPQHDPCQVRLTMKGLQWLSPSGTQSVHGYFRLTLRTPETSLAYGDVVEMRVSLSSFSQFSNPGVFQSADYRKRQGWVGQVALPDDTYLQRLQRGENRFLNVLYDYRDAIRHRMEDISGHSQFRRDCRHRTDRLNAPAGVEAEVEEAIAPTAVLMAMIIGESSFLTDFIRDTFTASGTNHILSISGSHLAMISFFVFGLTRIVLKRLPTSLLLRLSLYKMPSQWAALLTAPVVTLYALISGMAVATERSLIMILVYLFALWIGRAQDIRTSLFLAAFLIVIRDPTAIFDISFQLSFLAVLFMIMMIEISRPASPADVVPASYVDKLKRSFKLMMMTALGATVGTAPLTLYYFHQFSWAGFLANPLLTPFVGFLLLPFGLISALAAPFLNGFPFAEWHQTIGLFYFRMTRFFAELPGADFHFASPSLGLILLFYIIFTILFVRRAALFLIGSTASAFFLVFLGWGSMRIPPKNLEVTFLDVGQGDAALIEFPQGETLLVDGGRGAPMDMGRQVIAPVLWEKRIRKLDYLIGTHPQDDHMGGFTFLLNTFHVKQIITNGMSVEHPFYQAFLNAAKEKGIVPRGVTRLDPPLLISGCRITFLNPQATPEEEASLNDQSVVFRLSCPSKFNNAFLFTGDMENSGITTMLKQAGIFQSDILKAPHHGSRGSLHADFMKQVAPRAVIFSAGPRNRYGHPHPDVLAAYARQGASIYRTDHDGAVIVTLHPTGINLHRFASSKLSRVRFNPLQIKTEWENIQKGLRTTSQNRTDSK